MKVFINVDRCGVKSLMFMNVIEEKGNFILVEKDGEYYVAEYSRFVKEYWLVEESVWSVFPLFWAEEVAESLCL